MSDVMSKIGYRFIHTDAGNEIGTNAIVSFNQPAE
jgi:hypothetical protein